MIRRGFWLAVGAAGGIMGYRRAAALSRQVAEALGTRPRRPGPGKPGTVTPGTGKRHWARETIRFTRDVREGMDVYMSRHPAPVRPTLSAKTRDDKEEDH